MKDIKKQIEFELKKRNIKIRNANAIDRLFGLFPRLDALRDIFTGSKKAIKLKKQELTQEAIIDLLIGIDQKLNGEGISVADEGLKILIEDAVSFGNITGLEGKTSDEAVQEIFKHPVDVKVKNVKAKGDVTGVKLNVDQEIKIEKQVNINTNLGKVGINPEMGSVTLGKGMKVGLIDVGKKNTYKDCEMSGPDAGMIDAGEGTQVIRSNIHTTD